MAVVRFRAVRDKVVVLPRETRYSRTRRRTAAKAFVAQAGLKKTPVPDSTTTPRRRRRRAVQYLLLFIGAVLMVDALVGDKGLLAMIKARQDYRVLEQSLAEARAANARLREQARGLREDPDAIEALARRELGLMKPGEKLFIIKDVGPADTQR